MYEGIKAAERIITSAKPNVEIIRDLDADSYQLPGKKSVEFDFTEFKIDGEILVISSLATSSQGVEYANTWLNDIELSKDW